MGQLVCGGVRLVAGENWNAAWVDKQYACKQCQSAGNALKNPRVNAISRIAYSLVGSSKHFYELAKATRLSIRAQAKRLYEIGQDYTASIVHQRLEPSGFVYVITNPAWPGLVKLGMAVEPIGRLSGYQTSSPYRDYELEHSAWVRDRRAAEAEIHQQFGSRRVNGEWFEVSVEEARFIVNYLACDYAHQLEVTAA